MWPGPRVPHFAAADPIRALLLQVQNVITMPENDDLQLLEASR